MSWYNEGGVEWPYRIPIAVDNTAGGSPIDISIALPDDWDLFWDNVQTDGDDIRLVDADGKTKLSYAISSSPTWNKANRTGALEIDGYTPPSSDAICLVWLYWGPAGATDGSAATTIASAKTGTIYLGDPSGITITAAPEADGASNPRYEFSKTTGDVVNVWWLIPDAQFSKRLAPFGTSFRLEELDYVQIKVLSGGADQSSMYTETETVFAEDAQGRGMWVRATYKAGADGTNYTPSLFFGTTDGDTTQTLDRRALMRVKDVTE